MSARHLAKQQPESFAFSPENLVWAEKEISKYPDGKQASAVIALLWRAQEQHDYWLPEPAMRYVARMLNMADIRVLEVATFYSMYNLAPVGKYFVQLCGTTPCMLRGSEQLKDICQKLIGPQRHITEDGMLSWLEVECLGACCNAPMVQINNDYYEDLDPENFERLLIDLREGRAVTKGSQTGRNGSCPQSGPTTLLDLPQMLSGAGVASLEDEVEHQTAHIDIADNQVAIDEPVQDEYKPDGLDAALDGNSDDLKQISGIGPKLEGILNGLGIFHFAQIAKWTKENVLWVDDYLSFKGRIDRDDWIAQAGKLAEGQLTGFSKRYDEGETPSSYKNPDSEGEKS